MNRSRIEWCDVTWNPLTGCENGCPYCYARRIASRFATGQAQGNDLMICTEKKPFPYGFQPTFYLNRLTDPSRRKEGMNVFVCSMGDLFAPWVPDDIIMAVMDAALKAPQHTYMFLTKFPDRYRELHRDMVLPIEKNFWYGVTMERLEDIDLDIPNLFVSYEPILEAPITGLKQGSTSIKWLILGAETGNRAGKVIPEGWWIDEAEDWAQDNGVTVFEKNSLKDILDRPLLQQFPEAMDED